MRIRTIFVASALSLPVALAGCFVEVDEDPSDEDRNQEHGLGLAGDRQMPPQLDGQAAWCQERAKVGDSQAALSCLEDADFRWRTSCQKASCQELPVFLHYMLPEDLGAGRVAYIEAFDNQYFQGSPRASVRVAQFRAQTGSYQQAALYLEPGEYYLRAYLSTADSDPTPYPLGDMQLVANQPVGVLGALSGAEMVRVAPRSQVLHADPVHIKLDRLLKKDGPEEDTKAFLRISFKVAQPQPVASEQPAGNPPTSSPSAGAPLVPDNRDVHIGLYADEDLLAEPVRALVMSSSQLLVQGRVGEAEFLSPSLPEGDFVVFAYLDANGNRLYDPGELAQVYQEREHVTSIDIRKNRTKQIALELKPDVVPMPGR